MVFTALVRVSKRVPGLEFMICLVMILLGGLGVNMFIVTTLCLLVTSTLLGGLRLVPEEVARTKVMPLLPPDVKDFVEKL